MEKTYTGRRVTDPKINWEDIPAAQIDEYPWGGEYRPRSWAKLVRLGDEGYVVRMFSAEKDPRAAYVFYGEPVWQDSALEWFLQPIEGDPRYFNIEMNAAGNSVCKIGTCRADRVWFDVPPSVVAEPVADGWQVTCFLPFSEIARLFDVPAASLLSAKTLRGNFYKCGEETEFPHFGAWKGPTTPQPDFHTPGDFGTVTVE